MPLLDLARVKGHLRVFHDDEDPEIAIYQAAAEAIVAQYLDRTVLADGESLPVPDAPDYDANTMLVNAPISAAILLLTADLYENREPRADDPRQAVLPAAVRALLAPWRVWRTSPEDPACS